MAELGLLFCESFTIPIAIVVHRWWLRGDTSVKREGFHLDRCEKVPENGVSSRGLPYASSSRLYLARISVTAWRNPSV